MTLPEEKCMIDMNACAARALLNLAGNPDNRLVISKKGAIKPLVSLLSTDSVDAQQAAAGALSNLALLVPVNRFFDVGDVEPLVSLLQSTNAGTRQHASGALANLSVCPDLLCNTDGAIKGLSSCLLSSNAATRENAAEAFANMARFTNKKDAIYADYGVMLNLSSLMYDVEDGVRVRARDALVALGCVIEGENVLMIREIDGVKKNVLIKRRV
jgi:hypothetical protein